MFADYYQVRDWLEKYIPLVYGKEELGLARIGHLLKLLGNPQGKFKSVHVAGTSGKGSTAYYTAKLLQLSVFGSPLSDESQPVGQLTGQLTTGKPDSENRKQITDNWRVGLHVSPHLVDIRERMQIFSPLRHPGGSETTDRIYGLDSIASLQNDKTLMPMGKFLRLFGEVRVAVERIQQEKPELIPSYFEILVAASFKYFAEEKVDWAVVEAGLGGRLDATNVLMPKLSVITNIGLDHTEILGKTVEKIASEKAGIIKAGVPVVTGASGKALRVIEKVAREKGSRVIKVNIQGHAPFGLTQKGQAGNFLLAKTVVDQLSLRGVERRSNLKRDRFAPALPAGRSLAMTEGFPGRFEEIEEGVILDGAHNPDKVRFLINWLTANSLQQTAVSSKRLAVSVILILAFKKGKNWKKMVDILVQSLPVKKVIATEFNVVADTGRFAAVPAEEIADYLMSNIKYQISNVKCIENSQEAVFEVLRLRSGSSTTVLVTGSLYLVGEARAMWKLPEF